MSNGDLQKLTLRVEKLEKQNIRLCKRAFAIERRLLVAGAVLSLGHTTRKSKQLEETKKLNLIVSSLEAVSNEFKLRLEDLNDDFQVCCTHKAGHEEM